MMIRMMLAAVAVAVAVPAAALPGAFPTRRVQFADLDLGSAAGARVFHDRIDRAARAVCAVDIDYPGLYAAERRCRTETLARAQPQIEAAFDAARSRQLASGAAVDTATMR